MRKQEFEPLKMNLQLFASNSGGEPAGGESGNEPKGKPDGGDAGGDESGGEEPPEYEKNFLALSYSEELAAKAANAQYDGDTEELFKIQQDFQTALLKQKEAEWAKSRPNPPAGNDEGEAEDAFLKGFNSAGNYTY